MKIGILTYHCAHNYGAILQCYALQEYLKGCGYDAEVIDYRPAFLVDPYKVFQRYRFSFRKPYRLPYELYRELRYAIPRWISFNRSINRLIDMHHRSSTEVDSSYDVYIIGSDQIWNLGISHGDLNYFADFPFEKGHKKYIAYAASMEAKVLTEEDELICRRCLQLFDAIGVREKILVSMLQQYSNVEIKKVADPVFLLDKNKWMSLTQPSAPGNQYLLLYQVREDERVREYAKRIAYQKGLRFVEVTAWIKRTPFTRDDIQTASVEEFLTLFRFADYIVTTSFHGTAFSLIFEKQFTAIELGDGADSRVSQLLDLHGLSSRISKLEDDFDCSAIQYCDSRNIIDKERRDSVSFLVSSIISSK